MARLHSAFAVSGSLWFAIAEAVRVTAQAVLAVELRGHCVFPSVEEKKMLARLPPSYNPQWRRCQSPEREWRDRGCAELSALSRPPSVEEYFAAQ